MQRAINYKRSQLSCVLTGAQDEHDGGIDGEDVRL
jgi:hypothetical protein